jgi:ATPase subunit of ABC transporter with duplicated ATPase domains
MGALGLSGTKALQKIGTMSGGEKARVALAMFVLVPHNLLILDEPSNHLDVQTVEVMQCLYIDTNIFSYVVTSAHPRRAFQPLL